MGLAAGGKITQKIYEDTKSTSVYDEDAVQRVFIHTVSTAAWEVGMMHLFARIVEVDICSAYHRRRLSIDAYNPST